MNHFVVAARAMIACGILDAIVAQEESATVLRNVQLWPQRSRFQQAAPALILKVKSANHDAMSIATDSEISAVA
jgi:hypothetical protein